MLYGAPPAWEEAVGAHEAAELAARADSIGLVDLAPAGTRKPSVTSLKVMDQGPPSRVASLVARGEGPPCGRSL